jgi:hypothetical protein
MNNIMIAKASYLYEHNCSCMYNSAIHVEELRSMVGNTLLAVNPETAISIVIGCGLDSRGSIWVRGKPPIQWAPGDLSPREKQLACEADHSPPSSDEINNGGAMPPLPTHLHGMVLN